MGKDGELSIEDFIVATMNQYRNLSDQVIKTMFRVMDTDRDGWISAEDAYDALHPTGIHVTRKELRRLFEKYGVKRRLGESHGTSGARLGGRPPCGRGRSCVVVELRACFVLVADWGDCALSHPADTQRCGQHRGNSGHCQIMATDPAADVLHHQSVTATCVPCNHLVFRW